MKSFFIALLLIIALFGGLYAFNSYSNNQKQQNGAHYEASDVIWKVEKSPKYEEMMPYEIVTLQLGGERYNVGEYLGCDATTYPQLEAGEVSRKTCWFAGAGDDISVFFEAGGYVIKKRWTQETEGDEGASPVGSWETILTI